MVDCLSSGNTRTYISSAAIAVIDKVVAKRTRNNVSRFEISRKPVVRLNGKVFEYWVRLLYNSNHPLDGEASYI